ncbi:MAG: PAS domain S-box protein, partial [Candidatus Magasanikbacteria bacterium]|nr:PAS domain S-box protein [Candidatus Magasanikbacteria bacterium]
MEITFILSFSIILQIINIFFVLSLARLSGFKLAWWLFSVALLMRASRNILFLLDIGQSQLNTARLIEEILGCAISLFFLIGTFHLKPIFRYYQELIDELKENQERYKVIIKGSQDGILIVQTGKIKFVNPKLAIMFGYREEEVLGKDFLDFVDPNFKEMIENKYKERVLGRISPEDQYDLAILNKEGVSIQVEAVVSLIQFDGAPA